MKKEKFILAMAFAFTLTISSCVREDVSLQSNEQQVNIKAFEPSSKITIENGMFVFETRDDLDATLYEIANSDRRAVDKWEKEMNFVSQQNIFNQIVEEEEKLLNYYDNLPIKEQEYYKSLPEITSDIYKLYLTKGLIKVIVDPNDKSEYFDYASIDPSMSPIVNLDGFVKVEGEIYQFTNDAIKIILDGDFNSIEKIKNINDAHIDDNFVVFPKVDAAKTGARNYSTTYNFSTSPSWYYYSNKERGAVWVDGHSETLYPTGVWCSPYLNCTFTVRAEVLKKNIWGNWKHKTWKSFSFNATWDYSYDLSWTNYECSLGDGQTFYSLPSSKPTSPYSYSTGSVNNAYVSLAPHQQWYSGVRYFKSAVNLNYTISANLGGRVFNISN